MSVVVSGASLRSELAAVAPFVLVAVLAWGGAVAARRLTGAVDEPAPVPWQRSFLELPEAEQRLYRQVREGLYEVENARAAERRWPGPEALAADGVPPFAPDALSPRLAWRLAQQGVYVSYLGVPADGAAGQRWLVLYIEPEPSALAVREAPPPEDEEHHTLPDGTPVHVQVWTQPNEGPEPKGVLAFPVSEGWVQRVGR